MAYYDLDDVVPLAVVITDTAGAAADATTVVLTVTDPAGATSTPNVVHSATGHYAATFTPTMAGRHLVRWKATGANASGYSDTFDVRDPADVGLVSLAEAKAFLNIDDDDEDEELRRFIDVATDQCEKYTNLAMRSRTYVENYDGDDLGSGPISVIHPPILTVTSVVESGALLDPSLMVVDNPSGNVMAGGTYSPRPWRVGRGNVTITYVAGFAEPDPAMIQAVLLLLKHNWETQRGAMDSRNVMAGDTYDPRFSFDMPYRVRGMLDSFRVPSLP